ncbi:unnamed protein product [Ilex paraguariensis]|uniref:Clp R domain-containing protein n=1 Tax=Ilex paraguariensis TaxID=185542 RepID=A0ABC8S0V0_9AQUA
MRTGGYTVQHSLTSEAASTVKQAVNLARRRGHAQVTPLHVASAMLASSTGLLRRACLQSHSHPLQCKALELCFNVALNRLPTSASSPLFGPHSHLPSLSNALVAAFKRAQAHQRRGSIETQQQPILALKVELEQLIISILDDPSVSRVMREARFSSAQVKTNVEQAVSLEISSQSPPTSSHQSKESTKPLVLGNNMPQFLPMSQIKVSVSQTTEKVQNGDVTSVLDTMMNQKRKNTVIVEECLASAEGVVKGVIDKFDRGDVPGDMRFVQFISVPLFSLRNQSREVVEDKLAELKCLVKNHVSRGIVLYLGDLKLVSEFWSNFGEQKTYYDCPMEHMIMEISRLLSGIGVCGKLWLMGIATFQTYMRCKTGHPSLETLWELHPLTVPSGSLGLSLNFESDLQDQFGSKVSRDESSRLNGHEVEKHLNCCADCSANFKIEARSIVKNESTTTSTSSSLPSWLQQYKEENRTRTINDQDFDKVRDLCKKWNSICSSVHKYPNFLEKTFHFSSYSPSSSNSISSHDHQRSPKLHQTLLNWPVIFEPNQSPKEHQFFLSENGGEGFVSNMRTYKPVTKPDLLSNPNSSPNSASSSEASGDMECFERFKEFNSENMKILAKALERKVPWQKDIIPEIVNTILQCRSGMTRRERESNQKEETWLFFLGVDTEGKEKFARELSKVIFGSQNELVSIGLSNFSSTRADSTEEFSSKRTRNEHGESYLERFADSVKENPSRVFFMEDVEQVDYHSQVGIKKAIESGSITLHGGELVPLKDAIIIFSCESFSSMSRACSPPISQKSWENNKIERENELEERRTCASLDLNIATEEHNGDEHSLSDIGILDLVDGQVVFKILVL